MEKFGIFQLLDTLSALTAPGPAEKETAAAERSAPPAAENGAERSVEPDAAPRAGRTAPDALAAFLARHEEMRRRAEKK